MTTMAEDDEAPSLPYDILCIIAQYLDSHHDLFSLSLASHDANAAVTPFLYRKVVISTESLNTQRPWLTPRMARLVDCLTDDLQYCPDKGRAKFVRSLAYVREATQTPVTYKQRRAGRAFGLYSNGAAHLIRCLPKLQRLEIVPDFAQAVGNCYVAAIEQSSIEELLINNTCQYDRLEPNHAHDTTWEAIRSNTITTLSIHNIAPPEKRDPTRLRSKNVPACTSIWALLSNCANVKHLDLRLRMDSAQSRYDYLPDLVFRKTPASNDPPPPLLRLESLRLQNLSFDAPEFNRLSPESLRSLYLPLGGRKRFFRDLMNVTKPMIFPKNLKSLALDCLPLFSDRRERWLDLFDQEFVQLPLEELFILTLKNDFFIEQTPGTRYDRELQRMPSTKTPAIKLITAVGSHLKRILLKGSWELNIADLNKLLESCYNLEELGIALHWKSWDHDKNTFTPTIKRLTNLHTVHILNEPRTDNMNASFGTPLPTKHKVWGSTLNIDTGFMQIGAPQERLRYFGIGKKMWMAVLVDGDDNDDDESNADHDDGRVAEDVGGEEAMINGKGSGKRGKEVNGKRSCKATKRVLQEVPRDEVKGVKILEWLRFCDECWS